MPSNGDTSTTFGVYRTLCCDAEIVIGVGVAFPDCPNHRDLPTEWIQIADVDPTDYTPNAAGRNRVPGRGKRGS
jgi:hypothetical protein